MKRGVLIAVIAAVFLWTLLLQTPAPLVYKFAQRHLGALSLYGIDGRLGDGELRGFSLNGRPFGERLHWQLQPAWLALARLSLHLEGAGLAQLDGQLQIQPGGLRAHALHVEGSLKTLMTASPLGFAAIDGLARLDVRSAKIKNGLPTALDGRLELQNLAWTLAQSPIKLGSFRATTEPGGDPQTLVAKLETLNGPLESGGQVRLTPKDRRYELDLQLRAKADAEPLLRNLLQSLGQTDTGGWYHLRRSGTLPP